MRKRLYVVFSIKSGSVFAMQRKQFRKRWKSIPDLDRFMSVYAYNVRNALYTDVAYQALTCQVIA